MSEWERVCWTLRGHIHIHQLLHFCVCGSIYGMDKFLWMQFFSLFMRFLFFFSSSSSPPRLEFIYVECEFFLFMLHRWERARALHKRNSRRKRRNILTQINNNKNKCILQADENRKESKEEWARGCCGWRWCLCQVSFLNALKVAIYVLHIHEDSPSCFLQAQIACCTFLS